MTWEQRGGHRGAPERGSHGSEPPRPALPRAGSQDHVGRGSGSEGAAGRTPSLDGPLTHAAEGRATRTPSPCRS